MDYSSVGQPGVFVINSKLWRKQHMQEVVIFSKPSPKGERNLKNTIKYKFEFVVVTKHYRHYRERSISNAINLFNPETG